MKEVKRLLAAIVSLVMLLSPISATANSDTQSVNSVSSKQFSNSLYSMIEEYDYSSNGTSASIITTYTNRIIVKTNSNVSIDSYGAVAAVEGFNNWHIFQYETATEAGEALSYYRDLSYVEYAEADKIFTLSDPSLSSEKTFDVVPSLDEWGPMLIESETLIDRYSGSENLPQVEVAILDSGLDEEHPYFDYDNRVIDTNFNGVDYSSKSSDDDNGHGTHVAGIIYNNTSENVKICPYKVLDGDGSGSLFGIINAITLAADNGAEVINMSLGGDINLITYMFFSDAVSYACDKGVTVVVAAGNDGEDASNIVPASVNDVITVAAVDEDGTPSSFSNYGSFVDVAAPGRNINSAIPFDNNLDPVEQSYDGYYYAPLKGTSMATPFVSAASAMLKTINTTYTPNNIENIIKASAYKPDSWNESYGTGIVNFVNMSSYTKTAAPKITLTNDGAVITASSQAKIYYTTDGTSPIVGESDLYLGEPIRTSGVEKIKAVAFIEGQLQSDVTIRNLKWTKEETIRYKGKKTLDLPPNCEIKNCYSSNEDIVTVDSEGNIKGVSVGEATVKVYLEYNQVATYNVSVEYEAWQWFIIYFLFGFLWY